MKINTSFEITEDNILSAIKACCREYDIRDIDKGMALEFIIANTFELGTSSADKVIECLLDDDSKRSLLEMFADRLCDQIYTEVMENFGLGR